MFLATGNILYDPIRDNLKRTDQSHTLILDLPMESLAEYYQWFVKKQFGEKFKLMSPMFGTHVTVIRPQEVDLNHPAWLKYQGQEITVQYTSDIERHWEFWSLNVFSSELVEIRREFNLRTDFRLHMTVGRQHEWQPKPLISGIVQDTDYLDNEPLTLSSSIKNKFKR